jgi:hypothetical protein
MGIEWRETGKYGEDFIGSEVYNGQLCLSWKMIRGRRGGKGRKRGGRR